MEGNIVNNGNLGTASTGISGHVNSVVSSMEGGSWKIPFIGNKSGLGSGGRSGMNVHMMGGMGSVERFNLVSSSASPFHLAHVPQSLYPHQHQHQQHQQQIFQHQPHPINESQMEVSQKSFGSGFVLQTPNQHQHQHQQYYQHEQQVNQRHHPGYPITSAINTSPVFGPQHRGLAPLTDRQTADTEDANSKGCVQRAVKGPLPNQLQSTEAALRDVNAVTTAGVDTKADSKDPSGGDEYKTVVTTATAKQSLLTTTSSTAAVTTTADMKLNVTLTTTAIATTVMSTPTLSSVTSAVMSTSTNVTIDTNEEKRDKDQSKRKQPDSDRSPVSAENKKRVMEHDGTQTDITCEIGETAADVIKKMYTELIGIKTVLGTVDDKMENMKQENKAWINKLCAIEKDVTEVKRSVELAHNMIVDERKDRTSQVKDIRENLNQKAKELLHNANLIKNHSSEIKNLKDSVTALSNKAGAEVETEFPVKHTIVAQNVWYEENEDLQKIASTLLFRAMNLNPSEVGVVRVERKSGQASGSGLVKIELRSNEEVKLVLKNKAELRNSPAQEFREIYLRPSNQAEVLAMECSIDTLLWEMGVKDDYVRVGAGHLVWRNNNYRGTTVRRGRGERQSGRTHRGRGGHNSYTDNRRGPVVGEVNPSDEKIAQAAA